MENTNQDLPPEERIRQLEKRCLKLEQEKSELKADADRYRWGIKNSAWLRHEHTAYVAIPVALSADLSCRAMMTKAIDEAMAKDFWCNRGQGEYSRNPDQTVFVSETRPFPVIDKPDVSEKICPDAIVNPDANSDTDWIWKTYMKTPGDMVAFARAIQEQVLGWDEGIEEDERIVDKHNETVTALKAARDEAIEVLQDISSWLGQGGMWDTKNINLKEMEDRIREGIDSHIKVQAEILSKRKTPAICPCCERGMGG
ncbi:hypothetical protein [Ferrovum sp.]|uniref:hypothetical protein n=1 Tax=Ferrovum sp. TaxID=2609467 RepID=UPI002621B1C8|nr:hypothetical protein [Ferrovum sp.]